MKLPLYTQDTESHAVQAQPKGQHAKLHNDAQPRSTTQRTTTPAQGSQPSAHPSTASEKVYVSGVDVLLGGTDDAQNHDLLQALIHVAGSHREDVDGVRIILRAQLTSGAWLYTCNTTPPPPGLLAYP